MLRLDPQNISGHLQCFMYSHPPSNNEEVAAHSHQRVAAAPHRQEQQFVREGSGRQLYCFPGPDFLLQVDHRQRNIYIQPLPCVPTDGGCASAGPHH